MNKISITPKTETRPPVIAANTHYKKVPTLFSALPHSITVYSHIGKIVKNWLVVVSCQHSPSSTPPSDSFFSPSLARCKQKEISRALTVGFRMGQVLEKKDNTCFMLLNCYRLNVVLSSEKSKGCRRKNNFCNFD